MPPFDLYCPLTRIIHSAFMCFHLTHTLDDGSTPDKPVHCVVWAKELHKLLFGDARTSYLFETSTGGMDGATEAGEGGADRASSGGAGAAADGAPPQREESVYMHVVQALPDAGDSKSVGAYARAVFQAIFHDEIQKRLSMAPDTYKTAARPPAALDLAAVEAGTLGAAAAATSGRAALPDQRVLSLAESAALFLSTVQAYYADAAKRAAFGALEFSKDEPLDVDFVTAATNLRAFTFGIPMQSRFDVKSIAGNIIPAIATTNAIVAGLQVLEAIKFVRGDNIAETGRWVHRCCLRRRLVVLHAVAADAHASSPQVRASAPSFTMRVNYERISGTSLLAAGTRTACATKRRRAACLWPRRRSRPTLSAWCAVNGMRPCSLTQRRRRCGISLTTCVVVVVAVVVCTRMRLVQCAFRFRNIRGKSDSPSFTDGRLPVPPTATFAGAQGRPVLQHAQHRQQ